MSTHLCLFSVVREVVQVEGAVHWVVVHLQRARLIALWKQERGFVGQPCANVLLLLKAAEYVLKHEFSSLFSANFIFQIKVEISCCYYCQEKQPSGLL